MHNARRVRISEWVAGFSMVELAMVLAIIAVLAGSALNLGSSRTSYARLKQTYDKMDIIETAIATFVRLNGRLPCPAEPDEPRLLAGAANPALGTESRPANPTEATPCNAAVRVAVGAAADPDVFAGVVPVVALGLAPEFLHDGWGRRFTYVVEERFVLRETFAYHFENNPLYLPPLAAAGDSRASFLTIQNARDLTQERSEFAVYVLISHGENGDGAWNKEGTSRNTVATTDPGELQNAVNLWGGAAPTAPYLYNAFAQGMITGSFDDIVHFWLKDRLIRAAGGIVQDAICMDAARTLLPPRNNRSMAEPNYPIEGPIGCEVDTLPGFTAPSTGTAYLITQRHTDCMVRQVLLATEVNKRCLTQRF